MAWGTTELEVGKAQDSSVRHFYAQTAFTVLTFWERLDATLSPVSFTGGDTNV
jgi:hypothetical protein